jgi:hypothetical protein
MVQDKLQKKPEVQHDEAPPAQDDHEFLPRGEWWSLCEICHLAESAHQKTRLPPRIHYYSDDNDD